METIFDWLAIAIFAGLIVLFLNRSVPERRSDDPIWHYAPPAAGCAVANYFGNHGQPAVAFAVIAAVIAYTFYVLRPFRDLRS